jgi:hypothetical protein
VRHTRHIKSYYNLTTADYDRMLAAQGGVCAVCKQPPSGRNILHVDHDHRCCPAGKTCGKCIRGLLCHFCNTAIGLLDDSPKLTKSATEYLERN